MLSSSPDRAAEKLTVQRYPQSAHRYRMWAPSSVGAIDPVGMTNASTTNARKMKARMNATRMDSIVSLTFPSGWAGLFDLAAAGPGAAPAEAGELSTVMGVSYAEAERR